MQGVLDLINPAKHKKYKDKKYKDYKDNEHKKYKVWHDEHKKYKDTLTPQGAKYMASKAAKQLAAAFRAAHTR